MNDFESRAAVIVVGNAVVGDSVGTLDEVPWIITSYNVNRAALSLHNVEILQDTYD